MKRFGIVLVAVVLVAGLVSVGGCRQETVTVRNGEIVLCTEGEVISDTTESIEVPADEVKNYGVTTRVETCDLHLKLAALYETGQQAIADGDLEAAQRALAELVELDPVYRNASSQLQQIEDGETPSSDTGGSGSSNSGADPTDPGDEPGTENPVGPIVNLASFVPDTLTGFVGQGLIVDPLVLTRDYLPTTQGSAAKLVIVVEQFKDAASATEALENAIKPGYPDGAANVDIEGNPGYYGSNQSVAAVGFTDGALLVVLEIGSTSNDASGLKNTVIGLAKEVAR